MKATTENKHGRKTLATIQIPVQDSSELRDGPVKSRLILKQTKISFRSSTDRPSDGVECQSCSAERLLMDVEIQTDCGSQSCAACSSMVRREEVASKKSIEVAEQFRVALHHALEENEELHQAYEDLKKEYRNLSAKAERASQFSLILQAIIEDAEESNQSKDSSSCYDKTDDDGNSDDDCNHHNDATA